jgi:hypothetical protein
MEEFRKGNVVVWKRPMADLLCIVQEIEDDQVTLRFMDSPKGESSFVIKKDEVVKLAEEQERLDPSDFLEAVRKQREIHFPPKKGKKKKR